MQNYPASKELKQVVRVAMNLNHFVPDLDLKILNCKIMILQGKYQIYAKAVIKFANLLHSFVNCWEKDCSFFFGGLNCPPPF